MAQRNQNCWEFQRCGRGPAGDSACPACREDALDGVHGGANAGRACWVVTDTLCEGSPSGPFELKINTCRKCAFYHRVAVEQSRDHIEDEELLRFVRAEEQGA